MFMYEKDGKLAVDFDVSKPNATPDFSIGKDGETVELVPDVFGGTVTPTTPTVYTVSVTVNDATLGVASATPTSGETGTTVTLTATPNDGYQLDEWVVSAGGVTVTSNEFVIGTADVAIQANFTVTG